MLKECAVLQAKKSNDYQNPKSTVTQAQHYRRGIDSIHDIIQGKLLRAQSLIESETLPTHESLEDSYKDLINYASFAVAWLRGKVPGQVPGRDMYNRPLTFLKSPGISVIEIDNSGPAIPADGGDHE